MAIRWIYHMCQAGEWRAAQGRGRYEGSSQDDSGFIHFSTAEQIVESAARHRAGQDDLVLLEVDPAALGDALRWEAARGKRARGGTLFPHLYGALTPGAVNRVYDLRLGSDGRHVFPPQLSLPGDPSLSGNRGRLGGDE